MDSEQISVLRRMYAEGSVGRIMLSKNHPELAEMLSDLLTAAEFGNHIVSPQGIEALAVEMCEVMYPDLDESIRGPDATDLRKAARILLAQVTSAEAASKGRVS